LAYALAWLSVAGGNSVMPPWVRHQFPQAGMLIKRLRDTACADPACQWCREKHNARKELAHWFGFAEFRPEPADDDGRPLQQSIVEAAMRGEHVLAILPTGTGKSLCYQIPALSRFDKTGALTVVISPLVALMSDQVAGLEARNIRSCAALNGLLSMPERADVLDRVRLGDIGILIVSPEQLRNRTLRKVLAQREIGAWVLDEAHCLSKWGQDFRPDYRYVSRFIREKAAAISRFRRPLPDGHRQTRCRGRYRGSFQGQGRHRPALFQWRRQSCQSRFLCRSDQPGREVFAHSSDPGGRSSARD
jgi:ATP-dependent DNA helicase RecQ